MLEFNDLLEQLFQKRKFWFISPNLHILENLNYQGKVRFVYDESRRQLTMQAHLEFIKHSKFPITIMTKRQNLKLTS